MISRRIREHAASHNWFAVLVDLMIVIIGVFIGLQVDNWNQARIDRAEASDYRARIIENLKANEAEIAARAAYNRQIRAHAVAALTALQRPNPALGEEFLVDAYHASQVWRRPFQRTAYDELVDSGVARKVADAPTRAALSAYYVGTSGFDETALRETAYRERLRRAMDLRVQEAIRSKCGDIVRRLPSGGEAPVLPDTCRLDLDPKLVERTVGRLAALPELDQDLTRLIVDIDQKLALFARTSRNAADLRRRLEAAST